MRLFRCLLLSVFGVLTSGSPAQSARINGGDVVISISGSLGVISSSDGSGTVLRVGNVLEAPWGIDLDVDNSLVVANRTSSGRGTLVRVDPITGNPIAVIEVPFSSDVPFFQPYHVQVDSDGSYVVAEHSWQTIVRVSRDGAASLITPIPALAGILLEEDGHILATASMSTLLRIDPITGSQSIVSQGGLLSYPTVMAFSSSGELIVANSWNPGLVGIDLASGVQRPIASGGLLKYPYGLALAPDGGMLVSDTGSGIIRVDLVTGEQSVYSSFAAGLGILVYPMPESGAVAFMSMGMLGLISARIRNGSSRTRVSAEARNARVRKGLRPSG